MSGSNPSPRPGLGLPGLLVLAILVVGGLYLYVRRAEEAPAGRPAVAAPQLTPAPAPPPPTAREIDYDVVYVRQPRYGDETLTIWPEVSHPGRLEPGADLMLLHPDGSEEVLVEGGVGSVTDPYVSFDGQWVYYSLFPDLRPERLNSQREHLSLDGADIYRIHLASRRVERLTFGEFTPNTGAGRWHAGSATEAPRDYNRLGYGVLNLGPCPLPGGKVAFTSNRNGFEPPRGYTFPTLQLFVMDEDGSNVTPIAPMTIGSALHPTILRDGRIMFSSHENQGLRDRRNWGLWVIYPDGRGWAPLVSAFHRGQAFHFMTQLSSGDVVVVDYYNSNNNGFGAYYRLPVTPPGGGPAFHPAALDENPRIGRTISSGHDYPFRMPFTPRGLVAITPFTHADDEPAPMGADGRRVGKFTHPSAAPGGDLLTAWTPGPADHHYRLRTPAYDSGLYVLPGGAVIRGPEDLLELKNDPAYNEAWPRAVVPYRAIHGVDEPEAIEWLPNDGRRHPELPAGTPYGLVGTSSFYKRESAPGRARRAGYDGLDAFNTASHSDNSNWTWQGADAGRYEDAEIWAVRLLAMEPNTHRSYGPGAGRHFYSHAGERLRILGEIPLRKVDRWGREPLDAEGNPDTSFLAKLPADTPFTFQTLDRRGRVLNMAQTWHQVRPGEVRTDCGGCHAHSQEPLAFEGTAASRPDYEVFDLSKETPLVVAGADGEPGLERVAAGVVDVEFYRDVRPILERSCVGCHTRQAARPPGELVLDDRSPVEDQLPGDYARLARDADARWGRPPVIQYKRWLGTNASRYVRKFQSRRSLLVWKVYGERLDGWTNEDHPTERLPGDASTLPSGADPNDADLDFDGVACPPPGSAGPGARPLTEIERATIARWVDLGAPIDLPQRQDGAGPARYGWFLDDLRPTLAVSLPRPGPNPGPLAAIRVGVADAHSGVEPGSLSIVADFPVAGRKPGSELADLARQENDGIWTVHLASPIRSLERGSLTVRVSDRQGNVTTVQRTFAVRPGSSPDRVADAGKPGRAGGR